MYHVAASSTIWKYGQSWRLPEAPGWWGDSEWGSVKPKCLVWHFHTTLGRKTERRQHWGRTLSALIGNLAEVKMVGWFEKKGTEEEHLASTHPMLWSEDTSVLRTTTKYQIRSMRDQLYKCHVIDPGVTRIHHHWVTWLNHVDLQK